MLYVLFAFGTRLLSILPVIVTVSALESPKSTFPLAIKFPERVVVPVIAAVPDAVKLASVLVPVTPSVLDNVVAPVTSRVLPTVSVLARLVPPVTPRLPPIVTAPVISASSLNNASACISTLPTPFGLIIMFVLVSSVVIVLPLNLRLLRAVPPTSLYSSVKLSFTFVNAVLSKSPVPSS